MLVRLNNFMICSAWMPVADRRQARAVLKSLRRKFRIACEACEVAADQGFRVHNYPVLAPQTALGRARVAGYRHPYLVSSAPNREGNPNV